MGFWRPGGGHFATSEARKTARDGEGDREDAPRVFPKDTLRPEMAAFAESEREEVMEAMVPRTSRAERMRARRTRSRFSSTSTSRIDAWSDGGERVLALHT